MEEVFHTAFFDLFDIGYQFTLSYGSFVTLGTEGSPTLHGLYVQVIQPRQTEE